MSYVRHTMKPMRLNDCRLPALLLTAIFLDACSAANPLSISYADSPYSTEEVSRGVVNGLWEYDPPKNLVRLTGMFAGAEDQLAAQLADRHLVRVGINRSFFVAEFLEIVVLPEGWKYSLDAVVNDGRTINVGDVVDVRGHIGTNVESVIAIVRKCHAPPVPDENKDWNIGCKRVEGFDARGYGGEKHYLSGF